MPLDWTVAAPDLVGRGHRAFANRRFYEAQSMWEAEALGASGTLRGYLRGLATVAAGMLAVDEQRFDTAERLLARGRSMLARAPALLGTADLAAVRAAAEVVLTALRRGELADTRAFGVPAL